MKLYSAIMAVSLGIAQAVCSAQEFSANVILHDANGPAASAASDSSSQSHSRIFVSNEKLRLEMHGHAATVLLVNGAEHTAYAMFPAKKEYQPLAGGPSEYFRTQDAENACPDWQKASIQKLDCEKVGHEVLDGRQTVKYRNKTASADAVSTVWIDVALKFVIKWEGAGAGAQLQDIQEAKQAEDLFILPSDYDLPKPKKGTNKGFSHK
jgi:hypothetical protein